MLFAEAKSFSYQIFRHRRIYLKNVPLFPPAQIRFWLRNDRRGFTVEKLPCIEHKVSVAKRAITAPFTFAISARRAKATDR